MVVKNCLSLTFKIHFLCKGSAESILFFKLKNIRLGGTTFINDIFLIAVIFQALYFVKGCPIFDGVCESQ